MKKKEYEKAIKRIVKCKTCPEIKSKSTRNIHCRTKKWLGLLLESIHVANAESDAAPLSLSFFLLLLLFPFILILLRLFFFCFPVQKLKLYRLSKWGDNVVFFWNNNNKIKRKRLDGLRSTHFVLYYLYVTTHIHTTTFAFFSCCSSSDKRNKRNNTERGFEGK